MRTASLAFVVVLAWTCAAAAQELPDWTEYQNIPDGFKVAFPGQPKVTNTTWTTEYGYKAPAHVYSAERGREKYSVTVADYNAIESQGVERRKNCPPGAEPCIGSDISGPGYWRHDIRGAMIFATKQYLQKNVTMTNYTWQHQDLIEGAELQLTNNADKSRTFVFIAMHENKLYIFDGTVPNGYPQPGLFQQSVGFVDAQGRGIRYQTMYSNEIYGLKEREKPTYGGGGGGRGAGAAGGGRQGGGGQRGGGGANAQQQQ